MNYVNSAVRKKDAISLVSGKPVYTGDMIPQNTLVVKILRSPHAHAMIQDIDVSRALLVPGVACVLTYKDVPSSRYTTAGQTYPEFSPYDKLILDPHIRCAGDPVAIIGAETLEAAQKAMKLIKVTYKVLPALIDYTNAIDNPIIVHPEDDFKTLIPINAEPKRNICSKGDFSFGDLDAEFAACDVVLERTYNTKANNQTMMEPFTTFTSLLSAPHRFHSMYAVSWQMLWKCPRAASASSNLVSAAVLVQSRALSAKFSLQSSP